MKRVLHIGAAILAATVSGQVLANEALATKSGCLACHAVAEKKIGPSYKQVAQRYAGDAGAEAKLVTKVKAGGAGNWTKETGGMPMPPQAHVSDADIKTLVKWILTQK